MGFSGGSDGKAVQETQVPSLGGEDPFLVWEIPWTEEPGGLQSMELQRVIHD